jgi:hypothetical protein
MPNAVIRPPTKLWVVIVSCILAWYSSDAVYPTSYVAGSGSMHMGVFLVFMVIFKVAIEFSIDRWNKKKKG